MKNVMIKSTAMVALLGLAACQGGGITGGGSGAPINTAGQARAVVMPILQTTELPGIGTLSGPIADVLGDCIIEGATDSELAAIATNGGNEATVATVNDILNRPTTQACATRNLT